MATHRITYAGNLGWANGEAPSKFTGAVSSQDPASVGVDIFRSIGELRTGFASTEVGGSNVTDNITMMKLASVWDGSTATREVFAYGTSGKLYRITDANTPGVTVIKTVSNNADGLEVFNDYVYYAQTTQVGRYGAINTVGPTATDNFTTGLTATWKNQTLKHPLLGWRTSLYIGDANKLKVAVASGAATTSLTLDTDTVITALCDAGNTMLIGAGQEAVEDTESEVQAWLFEWDGLSSTLADTTKPTKRTPFPEPYIHNIQVFNGEVYVFGLHYLYKLVGNTFVIVTKLDCRVALGGVDVHKGQLWFKGSNDIRAIGTLDPQLPTARYRPYGATGTSITAIKWVQNDKLWVADNNDLNEFKTGSQTGKTWYSRMISFLQQESVEEVRLYLAANLASGDDVRVQIVDEVGNATTVATFDYATYGAVNEMTCKAHRFVTGIANRSAMQIAVLFNSGAARVREVVVVTKPVAQP
jgi:hypothetical protein